MPATVAATFENYHNLALATAYRYRRNVAFDSREDLEQSAALAALEALRTEARESAYSTINRVLYRETVNRGWRCVDGQWQRPEACYESWTEFADEAASDFEPCELDQMSYEVFANIYQELANYFGNWLKAATSKARFLVKQAERTTDYQRWLTLRQAAIICEFYAEYGSQGLEAAWASYQQSSQIIKDTNKVILDYPAFRTLYQEIIIKSRYDRAEAKVAAQLLMSEAIDQQQQAGKTETGTILAMTMFRLYAKYGSQVETAWAELIQMGFAIGDELHSVNPKSAASNKANNKEATVAA